MHKNEIVRKLIVWTPVAACVLLGAYILRPDRAPDIAQERNKSSVVAQRPVEPASNSAGVEVPTTTRDMTEHLERSASDTEITSPLAPNTTSNSSRPARPGITPDLAHSQLALSEIAANEPRPLTEPPIQEFHTYVDDPERALAARLSDLTDRMLRAPEVQVRRAAVSELTSISAPSAEVLDLLTQGLRDISPGVRFEVISALRTQALTGGDASAILRVLLDATYDADVHVVASAREGIVEVEQLTQ